MQSRKADGTPYKNTYRDERGAFLAVFRADTE